MGTNCNRLGLSVLTYILLILPLVEGALAQQPELVQDLNQVMVDLEPIYTIRVGQFLYFSGDDGVHGRELWRSDGTEAGTFMIKDLNPGPGGSSPNNFVDVGGALYFSANDGANGRELYTTNGQLDGIIAKTELNGTSSGFSGNQIFVAPDNTIFFAGNDGDTGSELFKLTPAGDVELVKDINDGTSSSNVKFLEIIGPLLLFVADDGLEGKELWGTDGTTSGTQQIKDIREGTGDGFPVNNFSWAVYNNELYFSADGLQSGVDTGRELWKSDGTNAGTELVSNLSIGGIDSEPGEGCGMFVANNLLFFCADVTSTGVELYKSDGTDVGTEIAANLADGGDDSFPRLRGTLGNKVVFTAETEAAGRELYTSDGTTTTLFDIFSGPASSNPALSPVGLDSIIIGGNFVFTAFEPSTGSELYVLTPAGVVSLFGDLNPGIPGSDPTNFFNNNGTLVFNGLVGDERSFWLTDGNILAEVSSLSTGGGTQDAFLRNPAPITDGFFFAASTQGLSVKPWTTDCNGSTNVVDLRMSSSNFHGALPLPGSPEFFVFNGLAPGTGEELWKSDGTSAGTEIVKDIRAGVSGSDPATFFAFENKILFSANEGTDGTLREPFITDGTEAGTMQLADLNSSTGSTPRGWTEFDGRVFFTAFSAPSEEGLFVTDGTPANTERFIETFVGGNDTVGDLIVFDDHLFFTAHDDFANNELWRSDGTEGGTSVLLEISSSFGSFPGSFTIVGDTMFFTAIDGENGRELWKTDGTAGGTEMVRDIVEGPSGTLFSDMVNLNGVLLFESNSPSPGAELWRSDGTEVGTEMIKDFRQFADFGFLEQFTVVGNLLYFIFRDGADRALWRSDGTEEGTVPVPVGDLTLSNTSTILGACGSTLLLGMVDPILGDELFRIVDECPQDSVKFTSGACGCGVADVDSDGDTTLDCDEVCTLDPSKTDPGACGCGVPDIDGDGDGTFACNESCDSDPAKLEPGVCGCGIADVDADNNGTIDCLEVPDDTPDETPEGDQPEEEVDNCPADPLKTEAGVCGCGVADDDLNENGVVDCLFTADLDATLGQLLELLKQLKKKKKKSKGSLLVLPASLKEVKGSIRGILSDLNELDVNSIATGSPKFEKLLRAARKRAKAALKTGSQKAKQKKKKAIKAVKKLKNSLTL